MKRNLILIIFSLLAVPALCQDLSDLTGGGEEDGKKKYKLDRITMGTGYYSWMNSPEHMTLGIGRTYGINIFIGKQFGKSPMSVAIGLGVNADNLYSDAIPYADALDKTHFELIPDSLKYSKNKMNLAYASIPLELRFKMKENDKGKSWKFAIGGRISYLLSSHLKYNGDDFELDKKVKMKTYTIENLEPINYGATFRFGYGRYGITAFYSLNPLFQKDKVEHHINLNPGTQVIKYNNIAPFSITLTVTPS
ncbi:MAG: porin family protein [Bacteroidota bacterium]